MSRLFLPFMLVCIICAVSTLGFSQDSFVNWENPHVHALDITPDGDTLLAVNTADNRIEVFDISSGSPVHLQSIPVGIDPVSVRARSDSEVWVVNHISDTVSIVDLTNGNVVATLQTEDEPCDVVFAGTPERAFVSCSQANSVLVFDPADLSVAPGQLAIEGEDPRELAVNAAGTEVYVAIFESGNNSTILGGGLDAPGVLAYPPNVVNSPLGPYAGVNPPPNDGGSFNPPLNPMNPAPLRVGLIIKNIDGLWLDDNAADWTELVSGSLADESGRPVGWNLVDHDVAIIQTSDLSISYATGLMNICMSLSVNPGSGEVTVVGTDAINEIRFEPLLSGRFTRVHLASVDPQSPGSPSIVDLNSHLDYLTATIPQEQRDQSLGDPRGIAWHADGNRGYVSGMGSNNLIIIDSTGTRVGAQPTVEVGEGPTSLALDEPRSRLYVMNKFEGSISVVDTDLEQEISKVSFYDPSPAATRLGRKHLYDTHKNSGLGHIACASCHVDSRIDRLAWDLGDPSGEMRPFNQNCLMGLLLGCEDWHPMKGPMSTQTLQDIIGKEPFHWRGDRNGLEEFNGAFLGLQGDDENLTTDEMQEFEDLLATVHFPPNPFRNFDNSLPTDLAMPGHFTTGRFGPAGEPLPNGNAVSGLVRYRLGNLDGGVLDCVTCHTLPTGVGPDLVVVSVIPPVLNPFPVGRDGEHHTSVVSVDGSTNTTIKIPQLRNLYEKVGFDATQVNNTAGFGLLHDGSVDSIARFVAEPAFVVGSDQDIANIVAFLLSFSGSDLPLGTMTSLEEPLGPLGRDTHAAVGTQITADGGNPFDPELVNTLNDMQALADDDAVGWVAKGVQGGIPRGYSYVGLGIFQSDRADEQFTVDALRFAADSDAEITFTVVPKGSETRIGIDRDEDGFYDRDELDGCSDPADPLITPPQPACIGLFQRGDCGGGGSVNIADPIFLLGVLFGQGPIPRCDDACDGNDDGSLDTADAIYVLNYLFAGGAPIPAPLNECGQDPTADELECGEFSGCP
ncbi:MAG: beta-propeller fold lactonase family protein [Planctomycetota bacterium]